MPWWLLPLAYALAVHRGRLVGVAAMQAWEAMLDELGRWRGPPVEEAGSFGGLQSWIEEQSGAALSMMICAAAAQSMGTRASSGGAGWV